jgi:hypothetical protein
MRRTILCIIGALVLSTITVRSQTTTNSSAALLENLYGRLSNNFDDGERVLINDSIRSVIDSYVQSDSVFYHNFTNLRYLGQITSPDSLVKIITWNLLLSSGSGRYYCYFIKKQETGNGNRIYRLTSAYNENPVKTDTVYNELDWYGALYYNLKPFIFNDRKCWILLGIDYGNPLISRKIIEAVSFNPQGSLIFGEKMFDSGEKLKFRDVFEYASNGMMSLRFSSDSSIVFDHLVPFRPELKNDRQYYGPDYSFDAYILKNGFWKLTINVDVRNKE